MVLPSTQLPKPEIWEPSYIFHLFLTFPNPLSEQILSIIFLFILFYLLIVFFSSITTIILVQILFFFFF